MVSCKILFIAIVGGVFVELFFQIIKLNIPVAYMPVAGFISVGRRPWIKYVFFRFTPLLAVGLFISAIYKIHFNINNSFIYIYYGYGFSTIS